jgi:hypothetical protein
MQNHNGLPKVLHPMMNVEMTLILVENKGKPVGMGVQPGKKKNL